MKRRTMILIISAAITVALIVGAILIFTPKAIVNKGDYVEDLRLTYHNTQIPVNQNDIINLLSKYNAVTSLKSYFPYETAKIDFEIDFIANHKPVHILLGEFNVWCESAGDFAHDILDAGQLKDELKRELGLA